jgi:hypothetical protein
MTSNNTEIKTKKCGVDLLKIGGISAERVELDTFNCPDDSNFFVQGSPYDDIFKSVSFSVSKCKK